MFSSWGYYVAAHTRRVLIVSVLTLLVAVGALGAIGGDLSSEGWIPADTETERVLLTLEEEYGQGSDTVVFLLDVDASVSDPATQERLDMMLAPLAGFPELTGIETAWSGGNPDMISIDGDSTYAIAMVDPDAVIEPAELEEMHHAITETSAAEGIDVSIGGTPAINAATTEASEEGILRAEMFSIPVTIVILLVVFGSVVAAGLPLMVGVASIIAALGIVTVLSTTMFHSIFAANVITMLGLGLGIDYSLFMVNRFREEVGHRSVEDAVAVTMSTVGKAILFSGITVMLGLGATQFFPIPVLRSLGQAGIIVTAITLVYGLTLLPAMLARLGTRVNALPIGRRRGSDNRAESGFWHRLTHTVMRRPAIILVSCLVLLLLAGTPALRLNITPGGPELLPPGTEARVVSERLKTDFASDSAEQIMVMVHLPEGKPVSAEGVSQLQAVSDEIAALDGVTRVDSLVSPELAQMAGVDWASWSGDAAVLPAPVQDVIDATVREDTVLMQVSSSFTSMGNNQDLVRDIRDLDTGATRLEVGGVSAASVDTLQGIEDGMVPAVLFVFIGAYIILFFTFGSILLPLKAIFMGALSITASLGAVVWVFQDGNIEGLLNFSSNGSVVAITPILVACILFGLSMDYEVLMLSRIQEEYLRTGDNTHAVATGLAHTGQVITGAATIMVVVFGGFMLADIVVIKSLGFGLALAVLIDATIVRGLLVPSTMRLMGRWNWWAPAPLASLVGRLGMSHVEPVPVQMQPNES